MGTEVPPESPPLIPGKWYVTFGNRFLFPPDPPGCTGSKKFERFCRLGEDIQSYVDNDWNCTEHTLFSPPIVTSNNLHGWEGPFDTFAECNATV